MFHLPCINQSIIRVYKQTNKMNFIVYYAIYSPNSHNHVPLKGDGKSKAVPLQAWTGPEGSRRLRLPDFKTVGT